ncbi:MAG TPA: ankyrin repeat domain-containing protein [Gammaproteobacteria bacterium]|nr:ankyrin repeat domain-containing protein [Gammaproteobacteria bacterium]
MQNSEAKNFEGRTALHLAVEKNDVEQVIKLIRLGYDVNSTDNNNFTPLHLAAIVGSTKIARLLLKEGANVNVKEKQFQHTPLHYAIINKNLKIAGYLIEANAEVDAENHQGRTSLHFASHDNYVEGINLLLKNKADLLVKDDKGFIPLHYAQFCNHTNAIDMLMQAAKQAFHMAVYLRQMTKAEQLLNSGIIDINALDDKGYTALHVTSICGFSAIAQMLIQKKADVNANDSQSRTPLHAAISSGSHDIVRLLVKHEADINAKDNKLQTPLHYAILKKRSNLQNFLLELAVTTNNDKNDINFLINNGANIKDRDDNGMSPRDYDSCCKKETRTFLNTFIQNITNQQGEDLDVKPVIEELNSIQIQEGPQPLIFSQSSEIPETSSIKTDEKIQKIRP